MKFDLTANLEYEIITPSTIIFNLHALRTPHQTVLEESFKIEPYLKVEELFSAHGECRFMRVDIQEQTTIKVTYNARVDNSFQLIDHTDLQMVPVSQLTTSEFPYLYPSRYCQSDKLFRFAGKKFGNISNPFSQVLAVCDWIYNNVEYISGSTNSQTSAFDTVTEQAGVCRDFAHLGIALCRALNIPARYFTGYAYQLQPQDFHACFEAFIGGNWILFDATRLAPLNGIVKISTGRDAADSAVASIFGTINCNQIAVDCQLADDNFEPFFYDKSNLQGITYQ